MKIVFALFVIVAAAYALSEDEYAPRTSIEEAALWYGENELYNFTFDDALVMNNTLERAVMGPPLFKQCGQAWSGNQLGTCSDTICKSGCAVSSVAMYLASRGYNTNPGSLNAWLKSNGGYANGCLIIWSAVDKLGRTSFKGKMSASESTICNGINRGAGIIANVRGGGHWVLVTGCMGGGVFAVNDPGFAKNSYTLGEIVGIAIYN